jgi:16S rRNA (cytosine967-C5)-methyltransferase
MSNARVAALSALLQVEESEGYSNIVIDKTIRKSELNQKDAALATAIFYGVLERRMTLDYYLNHFSKIPLKTLSPEVLNILRIGAYQILFMEKIPHSAAVNEAVNSATGSAKLEKAKGFINGVLRSLTRNLDNLPKPDQKRSPLKAMSIEYSMPQWILDLWMKSYGIETTKQMVSHLQEKLPIYARVNTTKISTEELLQKLREEGVTAHPVTLLPDAIQLKGTGAVDHLESFQQGLFHIQDLSSQLCCRLVAPQPGETVADLCAAPGGKTFTMAELMNNQGKVLSYDKYKGKVGLIRKGAERLGLSSVEAWIRDSTNPEEALLNADRVLCDAPCAGLGIIGRKPEIRYKDKAELEGLPALQYTILEQAARQVKIGGTLAYSTCSLNPAENGDVANRFLQEHPDFVPVPLQLPKTVKRGFREPENQLTLLPHVNGTDGFFISLFRRER